MVGFEAQGDEEGPLLAKSPISLGSLLPSPQDFKAAPRPAWKCGAEATSQLSSYTVDFGMHRSDPSAEPYLDFTSVCSVSKSTIFPTDEAGVLVLDSFHGSGIQGGSEGLTELPQVT
jgi:hypothetical protein